jgi:hypothetical protein
VPMLAAAAFATATQSGDDPFPTSGRPLMMANPPLLLGTWQVQVWPGPLWDMQSVPSLTACAPQATLARPSSVAAATMVERTLPRRPRARVVSAAATHAPRDSLQTER